MVQMVHSSCTDTAVNIPRLRIQYDNRHLTSWLPQGKTKKNTLWGYRKFCHCISLYISIMRWRNKNIAVRKQKITVRKVLSDYNLTTKMDMPGRQTFWEPGICNDIMCHAKEAVCIFYFRFSTVWHNHLRNKHLANYLRSGGNELATVRISAFCGVMLSNNSLQIQK